MTTVTAIQTLTLKETSSHMNGSLDEETGEIEQATSAINVFMPWLLIFFGTIFNILIILGMCSKNFRALSTSVYMRAGAINDVTSLIILLFAHWLYLNFPGSIARGRGDDAACKFFNFYGWGQADLGMMLTSAMTADRADVILRPVRRVDLIKRARVVVGVCVAVVAVKDFHFLFSSELTEPGRQDRMCDVGRVSDNYHRFYRHAWPWIDTVFVTLCFVVMVTSNCVLVRHVRRHRQGKPLRVTGASARERTVMSPEVMETTATSSSKREATATSLSPEGREETDTAREGTGARSKVWRTSSTMSVHAGSGYNSVTLQVTRMLLGESLALFLLSYPFSIHLVVTSLIGGLDDDLGNDPDNALWFNVVFYMLFANKCVNFLVYSLAGRKFRRAIVDEVLCRFRCLGVQFGSGRGRGRGWLGWGSGDSAGSSARNQTGQRSTEQNPEPPQQQQQHQQQQQPEMIVATIGLQSLDISKA